MRPADSNCREFARGIFGRLLITDACSFADDVFGLRRMSERAASSDKQFNFFEPALARSLLRLNCSPFWSGRIRG